MEGQLEPPWKADPDNWLDIGWILRKTEDLATWQAWFWTLSETEKQAYEIANNPPKVCEGFYSVYRNAPPLPVAQRPEYHDRQGRLVPPWIAHPNIPLGSIGWRMGIGEEYWWAFAEWYNDQGLSAKLAFREIYPEPLIVDQGNPWAGFYDRLEKY